MHNSVIGTEKLIKVCLGEKKKKKKKEQSNTCKGKKGSFAERVIEKRQYVNQGIFPSSDLLLCGPLLTARTWKSRNILSDMKRDARQRLR